MRGDGDRKARSEGEIGVEDSKGRIGDSEGTVDSKAVNHIRGQHFLQRRLRT